MTSRTIIRLAAALSATVFCVTGSQVSAETDSDDIVFGGRDKMRLSRVVKPKKPQKKTTRVYRRAYIKAPSYYTYRADPMARVDFASMVSVKPEVSLLPTLEADHFDEAVGSLDGYVLRTDKQIAEALAEYYSQNQSFIWVRGLHRNEKASAALAVLADADNWGLDAADYVVAQPADSFSLEDSPARLAELARFEMALSAKVLRYAHDAQQGRVDPNRISGYHDLPRKNIKLSSVLEALAEIENTEEFLTKLHPSNERFAALRAELVALRGGSVEEKKDDSIVIDPSAFIRPGTSHPEFPKVLAAVRKKASPEFLDKYGELLDAHGESPMYTAELVGMIRAAQREHRVGADGIIGRRTVTALSDDTAVRPQSGRLDRVRFAMERLRWLPSDLGKTHVIINQPGYQVTFSSEGREPMSMRVVVGKPSNQTSFFQDEIEKVVYNPYWGVPQSIIINEMMPRLVRDPGYLDRAGYEVSDYSGRKISSAAINWGRFGSRVPYDVRQKPGAKNALGELKIMFPNKHFDLHARHAGQTPVPERPARLQPRLCPAA